MKRKIKYIDVGKMPRKEAEKICKDILYRIKHKKAQPIEPKYR